MFIESSISIKRPQNTRQTVNREEPTLNGTKVSSLVRYVMAANIVGSCIKSEPL